MTCRQMYARAICPTWLWLCCTQSDLPHLPAGDALLYVWISTYSPSVGPAGANTVPSGRGGALIKANPVTANAVYTSYTTNDYSWPVIHTVSSRLWLSALELALHLHSG